MALSAMRLKLGVFGFLPTTYAKTNAIQMRPQSLRAVWHFTHVHIHAKTTIDAGDIRSWRTTVILITGKIQRPPIWATCWNQDGAVLGSPVYIYYWSQGGTDTQVCSFFIYTPVHFRMTATLCLEVQYVLYEMNQLLLSLHMRYLDCVHLNMCTQKVTLRLPWCRTCLTSKASSCATEMWTEL